MHALNRALERYGLKLTASDLVDIAMECQRGYGRLRLLPHGKERHLVSCHGKPVVVVYAPPSVPDPTIKSPNPRAYGTIVTILPPEAAMPNKNSYQHKRIRNYKQPTKPPKKARRW